MAATIPFPDVVRKLGPALFGQDWIGGLTKREQWLLERGPHGGWTGSMMPGGATYTARDAYSSSGDLEYDAARKRRDFRDWQLEQISDWLDEEGVTITPGQDVDLVDKEQFESGFARAFAKQPRPLKPPPRAALQRAFDQWRAQTLQTGVLLKEEAALEAMRSFLGPQVSREAVRQLLQALPSKERAPSHRPKKRKS